jgi:hypothetical protein
MTTVSRHVYGLTLALLAGGCGTCPALRELPVPIPVPCVAAGDMPQPPALVPESTMRTLPEGDLVLAIDSNRLKLQAYAARLEAVLVACRSPGAGSAPAPTAATAR